MMNRRTTIIATMAAVAFIATGQSAQAARPDGGVADASKRIAGFTAGQLLGEEWRQLLELPPDANPLAGTGDNCMSAGRHDKVLILWTTMAPVAPAECTVKPGTPVFFYGLGGECSSAEPPPYHGETEEEQRECTVGGLLATAFDAILVSIDGGPAVNIGLARYLAVSGQVTVHLPDPNIFGVPADDEETFVAAAYTALVRPLAPGTHTITVTIAGGPFDGITTEAVVHVVAGAGH